MMQLHEFGWNEFFEEKFEPYKSKDYLPARVILAQKNSYQLIYQNGEINSTITGKIRHQAESRSDLPVVGDWVAISLPSGEDRAIIQVVLPRKTSFSRNVSGYRKRSSGGMVEEQVIAANIDIICIVSGLDRDFNPRRIERYLTLIYNSGADPVIVLNKSDLCSDIEKHVIEIESIAYGIPVHPISAKMNLGIGELDQYFQPGKTIALLGSSGVGKSTIINSLLGYERQQVAGISEKIGKGQHTTKHRELISLPSGGIIMDNPGMRELQLWGEEEILGETFEEIEELAAKCRFTDCQHQTEPDCAVQKALEEGYIDEDRFKNYMKMKKELEYHNKRKYQTPGRIEKERWRKYSKNRHKDNQEF